MNDLSRRLLLTRMGVAGAALASSPFVLSAKNRATPKRTMTELRQALRGVHNFMVTPFRSNYDLDAEGLRKNVAYHAAGNTENMTIVVGGGLGLSEGPYWETLIAATRRHIWSDLHRDLPIVRAATGPDAGVIGAAAAAWRKFT